MDLDFRPPKAGRRSPLPLSVRARSSGERFLRLMLLVAVFAGAATLFNRHFSNRFERLEAEQAVSDRTGRLAPDHKAFARQFGRAVKARYGADFRLLAAEGAASPPPDRSPRALYLGLDPTARAAILLLPPLLGRAIDDAFEARLVADLETALAEDRWPDALPPALTELWNALQAAETPPASTADAPAPPPRPDPGVSLERSGQEDASIDQSLPSPDGQPGH